MSAQNGLSVENIYTAYDKADAARRRGPKDGTKDGTKDGAKDGPKD